MACNKCGTTRYTCGCGTNSFGTYFPSNKYFYNKKETDALIKGAAGGVTLDNIKNMINKVIYKVEFGAGMPYTNSAQALASVPKEKGNVAIVIDKDGQEITTNYFDGATWLQHHNNGGTNHFDFTYYDTTASQNSDAPNKNENDLSYNKETGDLYFLDSAKTWVHMNLNNKSHDVGFRLADISGDGNDDVYNVDGHRLMLTDASSNILSLEHQGQAVPKQYVDQTAKDILDRLNEFFQTQKVDIAGLTAKTVNSAITELLTLGTAQAKQIADALKHLQNVDHFSSFDPDSTDPTTPTTKEGALLTIQNPVNNERAYIVDKKNNVTYLYLRYNDKWEILNDNVGGNTANLLNKFINPCQTKMLKLSMWPNGKYAPSYNVKVNHDNSIDLSSISHEGATEGTLITNPVSSFTAMMVFHNNNWLLVTSPVHPNVPNVGGKVTTSSGDVTVTDVSLKWYADINDWNREHGVTLASVLLGRLGNPTPGEENEYKNQAYSSTQDMTKPGMHWEHWTHDPSKAWEVPTDTRGPSVENCDYFTYAGGHSEYSWKSILDFIQGQMPKESSDPYATGNEQFVKYPTYPFSKYGFDQHGEFVVKSSGYHFTDGSGDPFMASSLDSPVTKKYLESVTGKQYKTTGPTFPSELMNLSDNYVVQLVAKVVTPDPKTYEINLGTFELASIKQMQSGFGEPEKITRDIGGADTTFTINHTGITSTPTITEMRITILTKVHA